MEKWGIGDTTSMLVASSLLFCSLGRSKRLQEDRNLSKKLRYSYKYDKSNNIFLYGKNVHKIKNGHAAKNLLHKQSPGGVR